MTICIDLFAGPGGLGEGFTKAGFEIAISLEKQPKECHTLLQRKLHHALFSKGDLKLARALAVGNITVNTCLLPKQNVTLVQTSLVM